MATTRAPEVRVSETVAEIQTLDTKALDEMCVWTGADHEFLTELVCTYIQDASEQVVQLRQAWQKRQLQALADIAHNLRPASLTMGAFRMGMLCQIIEDIVRVAQQSSPAAVTDVVWVRLNQTILAVTSELQQVHPQLRNYVLQRSNRA